MEDMADKKALLDELMQFARGGMAKDMRSRFGKPPAEEEAEPDMGDAPPPEDPEIPGVEAVADDMPPEGMPPGDDAGGSGLDPEMMAQLLAALQAKGG